MVVRSQESGLAALFLAVIIATVLALSSATLHLSTKLETQAKLDELETEDAFYATEIAAIHNLAQNGGLPNPSTTPTNVTGFNFTVDLPSGPTPPERENPVYSLARTRSLDSGSTILRRLDNAQFRTYVANDSTTGARSFCGSVSYETSSGSSNQKAHSTCLVRSPLPDVNLLVNGVEGPVTVSPNARPTLTWSSSGVHTCNLTPFGFTNLNNSGIQTPPLTARTLVSITCTGPRGTATDTVDILVQPSVDLRANGSNGPITIDYDTQASLSWTSTNATTCLVSPAGFTGTSSTGRQTSNLTTTTTFNLQCNGPGGVATDSVEVRVDPPNCVHARMDDPYGDYTFGELQMRFHGSIVRAGNSARAQKDTVVGFRILFGAQCRYDVYLRFGDRSFFFPWTSLGGYSWSGPLYETLRAGETITIDRAITRSGGRPCDRFYGVPFTLQRWGDC